METQTTNTFSSLQEQTAAMLHELGFPSHRLGYKQLCIAIPRFSTDDMQSLTKDLYPYLAKHYAYLDWHAAESAIRDVIVAVWEKRDPAVWEKYFPSRVRREGLTIAVRRILNAGFQIFRLRFHLS